MTVKTQESKEVEVSVPVKEEQEPTLRPKKTMSASRSGCRQCCRGLEHTTSIYSGILRMADLMALQPNLDISAHIVAPAERREKVLQEIPRPVFAL